MLTTKYISTISFNSYPYLLKVLKQLLDQGEINFYSTIYHFAEEDEKKDHIHVFIVPNKRIDTDSLRGKFLEFELNEDGSRVLDKDGNEKGGILPLPFVSSKFDDWYLYNSHNERYLASKGLFRKYHYKDEDFVNSEDIMFTEMLHHVNWQKLNGQERIIEMISAGMNWTQILRTGLIPIQQIHQYQKFYDDICFSARGFIKGDFQSPDTPAES